MKLSTKIILPIILISALLITLSGCITPTAPSPGATTTTGGTITGTFETPEACCMSNRDHTEGWVPLVNANVSVIDSKGVTHTTKTDSDGKYWLTDVAPGIYYVVTACCECEDREGVYKDVVEEELKEGETYDAGIADCESTALGLMVDFLLSGDVFTVEGCNCYCNCFDEESQIYASLVTTGVKLRVAAINLLNPATQPLDKIRANADFQGFVVELCDLLEACCVEPGVAPAPTGPPPPPPTKYTLTLLANPAEGAASFTGAGTHNPGDVVAVDTEANPCYTFLHWIEDAGVPPSIVTGGLDSETLLVTMNGNVTLTAWFECPVIDPDLEISISGPLEELAKGTPDVSICVPDCATIDWVRVNSGCEDEGSPFPMTLIPPYDPSVLQFGYDDTNISFDYETGKVCFIGEETLLTYIATVVVTYIDPCGTKAATGTVYVEFKDCTCPDPIAYAGEDQLDVKTCPCPNNTITVDFCGSVSGTGCLIYEWDFGDGSPVVTDTLTPSHTYEYACPFDNPSYTVTLTVEDDCGSATDTMTVTITEYDGPIADPGEDQCIELNCESEALVDFYGSGTAFGGATITGYAWDFDGNGTTDSTEQDPEDIPFGEGVHTVTLTVTDSNGCTSTNTDNTIQVEIYGVCYLPSTLTVNTCGTSTGDYYFDATFSNGGGDIVAGTIYNSWCATYHQQNPPASGTTMFVYCTLELGGDWNKINWIINNRSGYSKMAVQWAIWHYTDDMSLWTHPQAAALVSAAEFYEGLHGPFCPECGPGKVYGALLTHNARCPQDIIIEVPRECHCPE